MNLAYLSKKDVAAPWNVLDELVLVEYLAKRLVEEVDLRLEEVWHLVFSTD